MLESNVRLFTEKALDLTWKRIGVINNNIANVSTPGYKAKRLLFENELRKNVDKIQKGRRGGEIIKNTRFRLESSPDETVRLDGNNVQIDAENVELTKSQFLYSVLVRQFNSDVARIRAAIGGK